MPFSKEVKFFRNLQKCPVCAVPGLNLLGDGATRFVLIVLARMKQTTGRPAPTKLLAQLRQ
jgi:hypothetical protein